MTQPGVEASRSESRMVPSTGVHEPHREPWLDTQRTLAGCGTPPRNRRESSAARRPSSASPRAARPALRRSCLARRSSMTSIQRSSSARDMRAGSSTIVVSPSRYADTVRRRRALRLTSIFVAARSAAASGKARRADAADDSAGDRKPATRAPYLRLATTRRPRLPTARTTRADFFRVHKASSTCVQVATLAAHPTPASYTGPHHPLHRNTPRGPHRAHNAVHKRDDGCVDDHDRYSYRQVVEAPGGAPFARGRRTAIQPGASHCFGPGTPGTLFPSC